MEPVKIRRRSDAGLFQPNTSSRAAINPELNESLAEVIANLPVDEIMNLAEERRYDFSQIHENIRDFWVVNQGRISTMQKATMASFLLKYPELFEGHPDIVEAKPQVAAPAGEQSPTQQAPESHPAEKEESAGDGQDHA